MTHDPQASDSEERYRLLVELSPDGFAVHQDGKIVYVNDAAVEFLGYASKDEIIGRALTDFVHPHSLAETLKRISSMTDQEMASQPAEAYLIRKDATSYLIESLSVRTTWQGRPAYQVIMRNIEERRRTEAVLRQQANLVANVSDAIIGLDRSGVVTSWNPAATEIYGWSESETLGQPLHEVWDVDAYDLVPGEDGRLGPSEAVHMRKDRSAVPVRVSVATMRNELDEVIGLVAMSTDITQERREAEERQRLAASKEQALEQLQAALDAVATPVMTLDRRARIISHNAEAVKVFGIPGHLWLDAQATTSFTTIAAPDESPEFFAQLAKTEHGSGRLRLRTGQELHYVSSPQRVADKLTGVVLTFFS